MKDGAPITIAARSLSEKEECLRRGLKPFEDRKKKKTPPKKAPLVRSKTK